MDFSFANAVTRAPGPEQADRAEFYLKPVQDEAATATQGRPIFKMVEYVKIEVGGDRFSVIDRPAKDEHRQRYAPQYSAFKANGDQDAASGTLLIATGFFDAARAEELKYYKIRTAEQYAATPDGNLAHMGMGALEERRKCRDYIQAAKGAAPVHQLYAELGKRDSEIATLKQQLLEQAKRLDALAGASRVNAPLPVVAALEANGIVLPEAPKKRGRPKKVEPVAS